MPKRDIQVLKAIRIFLTEKVKKIKKNKKKAKVIKFEAEYINVKLISD